jgi:hypothetical protein
MDFIVVPGAPRRFRFELYFTAEGGEHSVANSAAYD